MPFSIPYNLHDAKIGVLVEAMNDDSLCTWIAGGTRLTDESKCCSFEGRGKRVSVVVLLSGVSIEAYFLNMIIRSLEVDSSVLSVSEI